MKKDTSFHDYIVYDLMNRLSNISSRPMMSGWCIYSDGVPFASIIGNQLYLKAKGEMAEKLASLGWTKFNYKKSDDKVVSMNYWLVPDELIDDPESFEEIAKEVLMY
ncbi:MAG: TfoX/Sxy family protein [Candidatus Paceibacterota bacterium]|jgi:DNA transformation protein